MLRTSTTLWASSQKTRRSRWKNTKNRLPSRLKPWCLDQIMANSLMKMYDYWWFIIFYINSIKLMTKPFIRLAIFTILIQLLVGQCTHPIFCSPPILESIARSNIFKDSKTFVDLVLKVPVETALSNFRSKSISAFVNESFHSDPNVVLESAQFADFNPNPSFL